MKRYTEIAVVRVGICALHLIKQVCQDSSMVEGHFVPFPKGSDCSTSMNRLVYEYFRTFQVIHNKEKHQIRALSSE